ncbi:MAG: secondary thiamine-phosphate synthase enzyme YjbQ [Rhodospirillaceae bacterium]|nr:secondary thiamine-phosphate synthase enzyme YjbQ [Rhodospirillaceae bacterium]
MKQAQTTLKIKTNKQGLFEITPMVANWLHGCNINAGILTVFCRHTSASLIIQENADPDVALDLQDFYKQLVAEGNGIYRHSSEGVDDMPGHIKSTLSDVSLSIPVINGSLALGTWQGIFLFEHRARDHNREVVLHIMGE